MAGKRRLSGVSPEDRVARHEVYKASQRKRHADISRREGAELALAEVVVKAHKMLGRAIERARKAGIADPQALVAEFVDGIAAAREADLAREQGGKK